MSKGPYSEVPLNGSNREKMKEMDIQSILLFTDDSLFCTPDPLLVWLILYYDLKLHHTTYKTLNVQQSIDNLIVPSSHLWFSVYNINLKFLYVLLLS